MQSSNQKFIKPLFSNLFILGFLFMLSACDSGASKEETRKVEVPKFPEIIWNVKAIQPDGQTLDIKAFDAAGNPFDIKAIQDSDQDSFLDVKAIGTDRSLPVKILVSSDKFSPVKAVDKGGITYDVKAITADGEKLDVKGVGTYGYVVIMKAINKDGGFYAVKAISPTGKVNDIKGIKINIQEREMYLKGSSIHAHLKAMHPAINEESFIAIPKPQKKAKKGKQKVFKRIIWNVKAVTPEGKNLAIKAIDIEGNTFDVKATQDSKQHSFMNIKAFVDKNELPVKVVKDSLGGHSHVKAFGRDGTVYAIKAITEDDVQLDIRGIGRSGTVINIKAINEHGDFYGVKAFAPDGTLNEVKGIKIFEGDVELRINGNPIFAHLKAINQ